MLYFWKYLRNSDHILQVAPLKLKVVWHFEKYAFLLSKQLMPCSRLLNTEATNSSWLAFLKTKTGNRGKLASSLISCLVCALTLWCFTTLGLSQVNNFKFPVSVLSYAKQPLAVTSKHRRGMMSTYYFTKQCMWWRLFSKISRHDDVSVVWEPQACIWMFLHVVCR